jgi:hypothetical protein
MSTIHLQVAPRVAPDNPRGARAAAYLFVALWRLGAGLLRAAAPRPMSVEEEAQAVREMALQYQKADPRFAADLMAAADRHERTNG